MSETEIHGRMEHRMLHELEQFEEGKAIHVPLYSSEHVRVVMLCIAPGAGVAMHKHPGFEVTITPLRGKGAITSPEGKEITLEPGTIHFADAECGLDPHNPFAEPFVMLVHRVKL
jgi:quercetin dioxygenase-like cupin family protein